MASISAFAHSTLRPSSHPSSSSSSPLQFHSPSIKFQTHFKNPAISSTLNFKKHGCLRPSKLRAVAEEEGALVPDETAAAVSVAVSPSDVLTMFFQAEGTMSDSAVPLVTKALEEVEDITDLKVHVLEGIASVELTKQTTVQATGVASSLVEVIQGSGFKLQTLNLSFQDEEDLA